MCKLKREQSIQPSRCGKAPKRRYANQIWKDNRKMSSNFSWGHGTCVLAIYCCITNCPNLDFKVMIDIYYLTVSLGQELRSCLARLFRYHVSNSWLSRCWWGCSYIKAWLAKTVYIQDGSVTAGETMLAVGRWAQLFAMWPLHRATWVSTTWQLAFP